MTETKDVSPPAKVAEALPVLGSVETAKAEEYCTKFPLNRDAESRSIPYAEALISQISGLIQMFSLTSEAHTDGMTDYLLAESDREALLFPGMDKKSMQHACGSVGQWIFGEELTRGDREGITSEIALGIASIYMQAIGRRRDDGIKTQGYQILLATAIAVARDFAAGDTSTRETREEDPDEE